MHFRVAYFPMLSPNCCNVLLLNGVHFVRTTCGNTPCCKNMIKPQLTTQLSKTIFHNHSDKGTDHIPRLPCSYLLVICICALHTLLLLGTLLYAIVSILVSIGAKHNTTHSSWLRFIYDSNLLLPFVTSELVTIHFNT